MLELPRAEPASRVGELERPQEVRNLLEVGADSVDLVDEVLHADNAKLAQVLLYDGIVCERDALLVDLAIAALVDQVTNRFVGRIAVGDEGFHNLVQLSAISSRLGHPSSYLQHLSRGLGDLNEHAIVDLEKTKKLQSLALLGVDLVDTAIPG